MTLMVSIGRGLSRAVLRRSGFVRIVEALTIKGRGRKILLCSGITCSALSVPLATDGTKTRAAVNGAGQASEQFDIEDCRRWQGAAEAVGWLAPTGGLVEFSNDAS